MNKTKSSSETMTIIKNTLILFAITAVAGLFLSLVNSLTADAIAEQKVIQRENALQVVLPDSAFTELEQKESEKYPKVISVYEAKTKDGKANGYAFLLNSKGYGGVIAIMVGIDHNGVLSGMDILTHAETPGLGANADGEKFKGQIQGKETTFGLVVAKGNGDGQNVDAISGATITSEAVVSAVNEAIAYYNEVLKGGK